MALTVNARTDNGSTLVGVSGEVDVSNAAELREQLEEVLSGDATAVTIDLSQVPYIDSTGIGVLVGAAHRAKDKGVELVVSRPQSNVARVLALLGVSGELNVTGA